MSLDLNALLTRIERIALEAGEIIMAVYARGFSVGRRKTRAC